MSINNNALGCKPTSNHKHTPYQSKTPQTKEEELYSQVLVENQKLEKDLSLILGSQPESPMLLSQSTNFIPAKPAQEVQPAPKNEKIRSIELRIKGHSNTIQKYQESLKNKEESIQKNYEALQILDNELQSKRQSEIRVRTAESSPLKGSLLQRKQNKKNLETITINEEKIKSLEKQLRRLKEVSESITKSYSKVDKQLQQEKTENDSLKNIRTQKAIQLHEIKNKIDSMQAYVKEASNQCEEYASIMDVYSSKFICLKSIAQRTIIAGCTQYERHDFTI